MNKIRNLFNDAFADVLIKEKKFKSYIIKKEPLDFLYFKLLDAKRRYQKMQFTDNFPSDMLEQQELKIKDMQQEIDIRLKELEGLVLEKEIK